MTKRLTLRTTVFRATQATQLNSAPNVPNVECLMEPARVIHIHFSRSPALLRRRRRQFRIQITSLSRGRTLRTDENMAEQNVVLLVSRHELILSYYFARGSQNVQCFSSLFLRISLMRKYYWQLFLHGRQDEIRVFPRIEKALIT